MPQGSAPAILVVTGASGAGKTTSVRALEARTLPGVRCFYFDAVGVPGAEEMERDFGSAEAWQAAATERWMHRLLADTSGDVAVLDGQTRPSVVREALRRIGAPPARIVLLDCDPAERARRLAGPRGQAELATARMDAWAAYLRGQADALDLPVVDTTDRSVAEVTAALAREVERLRAARGTAVRDAMPDRPVEFERGEFVVTTDRGRLPVAAALGLLAGTHWAGEVRAESYGRAMANSICFGVLHAERLVGFGRAVTDLTTYAYWTDVVIDEAYRGRGLGRWLVDCMLAHPELQGLRRVALLTRDARFLYESIGFTTELGPRTYLERRAGARP